MPVERWPKAARERSAWLRARGPPLLRPSKVPSRKAPSLSRVSIRNIIGDECQHIYNSILNGDRYGCGNAKILIYLPILFRFRGKV
jgi:hypothetical protein